MLDKNFYEFKDEQVERPIDYTPEYQLTKVANDRYQFYDFSENRAQMCSAKNVLKQVASIRGGRYLDSALTNKIIGLSDLETITISASATKLSKTASFESESEPWKVVSVHGVEYFVCADANLEEDDQVKKVTAAVLPTKHTYAVRVLAHNLKEIARVASCAEEKMCAIPGTTQIPNTEEIYFDVESEEAPEQAQKSIQRVLEDEGVYLPDQSVGVSNDMCPCGCGKAVHEKAPEELKIPDGMYLLVPANTNRRFRADKPDTLDSYASVHYNTYKIYDSKLNVLANVIQNKDAMPPLDPDSGTYGEDLTEFLMQQHELASQASGPVDILQPDGMKRSVGEEPQVGDQIIDDEGVVTKVTKVEADEEQPLTTQGVDEVVEGGEAPVRDPNEKDASASGKSANETVRRYKGLKQDPDSEKYTVYLTVTTEHVYDTADDAAEWLKHN